MRISRRFAAMAMAAVTTLVVGCSESDTKGITLSSESNTVELASVTNQSNTLSFNSTGDWTASCPANWLTFTPKSGQKGDNTIIISTTQTNRTRLPRTAQMVIETEGKEQMVNVKQRDEFAVFEIDELNVGAEESTATFKFTTNIEPEGIRLFTSYGMDEWVNFVEEEEQNVRTRVAPKTYTFLPLRIKANTSSSPREGWLLLGMTDVFNEDKILFLDTLFIHQSGQTDGYISTDYSADGRVGTLSRATEGRGIPVVIMGDGFVDRDIANGTYSEVMNQAMENLFSEEPIRSLRQYFNVYTVDVVSKTNILEGSDYTTLGTVPDRQTTSLDINPSQVMNYVRKVAGIDSLNTLAVVIPNTNLNKGVTYLFRSDDPNRDINYSIAICPVIDRIDSEIFREVLTHEAVGHGFAKLADEYVRSTEGSATDEDIEELKKLHTYNWFLNVDSESDSTKVLWSRFIFDADYASEHIGTYEGGYTFYKNVFRPSQESMMRSNDAPFNAPSRQAIYNKVMKRALGRTPTYEEFVAFDRQHQPTVWQYNTRTGGSSALWQPERARPRIIKLP